MMDEIAHYKTQRWKALNNVNALFTRPTLQLDGGSARQRIDPEGRLGDLVGKRVLCLAGGGGQQSAIFGLLGAQVTVLDLSEEQLQRDREVADHYHLVITTEQGDMRDLSRFEEASFDLVWHPYSLNFVPDVQMVFRQVARLLPRDGRYCLQCANPFSHGLAETDWNGKGYILKYPYIDGAEIISRDPAWVSSQDPSQGQIPPPREYRHTLSTVVNGLIKQGFIIQHLSDTSDMHPNVSADPGTWNHMLAYAPPWLAFWTIYRP
jgi:2-polyprenyl-3-methyl-5-hydroxy-6-metoxy-1,4-benzoquinol methylase